MGNKHKKCIITFCLKKNNAIKKSKNKLYKNKNIFKPQKLLTHFL